MLDSQKHNYIFIFNIYIYIYIYIIREYSCVFDYQVTAFNFMTLTNTTGTSHLKDLTIFSEVCKMWNFLVTRVYFICLR